MYYNSGVGEGVLPEDALVNNIPYNQETNNQNKPMQSYGKIHPRIKVQEGWERPLLWVRNFQNRLVKDMNFWDGS